MCLRFLPRMEKNVGNKKLKRGHFPVNLVVTNDY